MSDSVLSYQSAVGELLSAKEEIERMKRVIEGGAAAVADWRNMHVKHSDVSFPAFVTTDPENPFVDAETWPSGDELAHALIAWQDAVAKAEEIWGTLPEDERIGFRPPKQY